MHAHPESHDQAISMHQAQPGTRLQICVTTGEALALLMKIRPPPGRRHDSNDPGASTGHAPATAAGESEQVLLQLAKASRILCTPAYAPPPADACGPPDPGRVSAAVASVGLPALPGPFAGSARWPVSISQEELGPLVVQQLECLLQLPLPVWVDTVTGACLGDICPAHVGASVRLAEPACPRKLRAVGGVCWHGEGGAGEAAERDRGPRRGVGLLKTVAAPAAALQRLWRECHDVLVQKAVAAASQSGALQIRGASRQSAATPQTPALSEVASQASCAAAAERGAGDGAARQGEDAALQDVGAAPHRLHGSRATGSVAGPVYSGGVTRASPAKMQQHMAASAAAFRAHVASHIAAGARPRPGLLLRDALKGNCNGAAL